MAPCRLLALAAIAVPLVSASPLRPRADTDFVPTPTNTWVFPGVPSVTIVVPTGYPGGPIVPDPVYPGGPIVGDPGSPGGPITGDPGYPGGPIVGDPTYPGAPIVGDPGSPGGGLIPDDPSYGDDSTLHAGRSVSQTDEVEETEEIEEGEDESPPPTFGFGSPSPPTITTSPLLPGGPLNGDGGSSSPPLGPGIIVPGGPMRPGRRGNAADEAPTPTRAPLPFNPGGPLSSANDDGDVTADSERNPTSSITADAACTYTLANKPLPDRFQPCSWNGILTVYPSTATVVQTIDCQGCGTVHAMGYTYACPIFPIRTTKSVNTATTTYETRCAATAATTTAPSRDKDEN